MMYTIITEDKSQSQFTHKELANIPSDNIPSVGDVLRFGTNTNENMTDYNVTGIRRVLLREWHGATVDENVYVIVEKAE